jgi:hypothetical protein
LSFIRVTVLFEADSLVTEKEFARVARLARAQSVFL